MQGGPRRRALDRWRDGVAVELGVPRYVVLRDAAVAALATCDARDGRALAALPGLGPRTLAKHGEALLRLIAAHPPDHYLLRMDPGDAEILDRGDRRAGERRRGERRASGDTLPLTDAERRHAERRQGNRRSAGC